MKNEIQKSKALKDCQEDLAPSFEERGVPSGDGSVTTSFDGITVHCLTIIGQIEGHYILPSQNKTTKYEHVIPQIVAVEESPLDEKKLPPLSFTLSRIGSGLCRTSSGSGAFIRRGVPHDAGDGERAGIVSRESTPNVRMIAAQVGMASSASSRFEDLPAEDQRELDRDRQTQYIGLVQASGTHAVIVGSTLTVNGQNGRHDCTEPNSMNFRETCNGRGRSRSSASAMTHDGQNSSLRRE